MVCIPRSRQSSRNTEPSTALSSRRLWEHSKGRRHVGPARLEERHRSRHERAPRERHARGLEERGAFSRRRLPHGLAALEDEDRRRSRRTLADRRRSAGDPRAQHRAPRSDGKLPGTVTRTAGDDGSVSVKLDIPPTSLRDLHLPAAALGPLVTGTTRLEAQGEMSMSPCKRRRRAVPRQARTRDQGGARRRCRRARTAGRDDAPQCNGAAQGVGARCGDCRGLAAGRPHARRAVRRRCFASHGRSGRRSRLDLRSRRGPRPPRRRRGADRNDHSFGAGGADRARR